MNRHLVIIDPQHDFCDKSGTLFVPGAIEDMNRVGRMISKVGRGFEDIHVTVDSHQILDIAHPLFWKNQKGENPNPFTIITKDDVQNGIWMPYTPLLRKWALDYVSALEAGGRYPLCIWPPHCLIGTLGATVVPQIMNELINWTRKTTSVVDFVAKGSNPLTEHYSAVKAEVEIPSDPTTQLNLEFIQTLEEADEVLFGGEALSHCEANTIRDIVTAFSSTDHIKKCVILTDGSSSVQGFEQLGQDFINEMTSKGMQTALTTDF